MEENAEQTKLHREDANSGPHDGSRVNPVSPFVVVPERYEIVSLEGHQLRPDRPKGKVTLDDLASFVLYLNKHSNIDTAIYVSQTARRVVAVLNEHGYGGAAWRDHVAVYVPPLSREWQVWSGQDGKPRTQLDFAQFLEDNLPDIVVPEPASMLEIARTLEVKKKVSFSSSVRLQSGAHELNFEEEVSGTAQKGKLQIPETFEIGVPVFEGDTGYRVTARLRYRLKDANVAFWYDLVRPHKVIEDAFARLIDSIRTETQMPVLKGDAGVKT